MEDIRAPPFSELANLVDAREKPNVWTPAPTERHAPLLKQMLKSASGGGNLVPDADLAALAVEHGLLLCSSDADFARFPGLRWTNPLAGGR